jgi:hypothetical protein
MRARRVPPESAENNAALDRRTHRNCGAFTRLPRIERDIARAAEMRT